MKRVEHHLAQYLAACNETRQAARLVRQYRVIYFRACGLEGASDIMKHLDEHLKAARARREWWRGELKLDITRHRARRDWANEQQQLVKAK